jgi:hypothetical protein
MEKQTNQRKQGRAQGSRFVGLFVADDLLHAVDKAAAALGVSRSEVFRRGVLGLVQNSGERT